MSPTENWFRFEIHCVFFELSDHNFLTRHVLGLILLKQHILHCLDKKVNKYKYKMIYWAWVRDTRKLERLKVSAALHCAGALQVPRTRPARLMRHARIARTLAASQSHAALSGEFHPIHKTQALEPLRRQSELHVGKYTYCWSKSLELQFNYHFACRCKRKKLFDFTK